jgi:hypothetical protein
MPVIYRSLSENIIKRNVESIVDLEFKNLLVGQCRFINTIPTGHGPTTWPYYLIDVLLPYCRNKFNKQ